MVKDDSTDGVNMKESNIRYINEVYRILRIQIVTQSTVQMFYIFLCGMIRPTVKHEGCTFLSVNVG